MSNEMIIELTKTSLQFIKLPDTYDKDIREDTYILRKHGWGVHSCSCPQVSLTGELFLPGCSRYQDNMVCHFLIVLKHIVQYFHYCVRCVKSLTIV